MKKILGFAIIALISLGMGCFDSPSSVTSSPVVEKAKASLVINAAGNSGNKVSAKSIMKDASDPSVLPTVEGISCDSIEAAAFAYEPNSTVHSTNYAAMSGTNSPVGNWSAYYFMPSAYQRVIKQGDITDVSAWNENPDDLLASGFESSYYNANASFSMDIVALSMKQIGVLVKEGSISPDTGSNYTIYGWATNPTVKGSSDLYRFDRYPEYQGANFGDKLLYSRDTAFNGYDGFNAVEVNDVVVLFVNKDIFTDITNTTIIIGFSGGHFKWFDNVDRPVSTPIIQDLIYSGFADDGKSRLTEMIHYRSTYIVVPYSPKKILLGNGTADENTITNPVVSISFDVTDLLSSINTWNGNIGGLYSTGWENNTPVDNVVEIKSDIANGINPFGMNISVSEK